MKKIFSFLMLLIFLSCNPSVDYKKELDETKNALKKAESKIDELQNHREHLLVHEVYFNVKDDLTKQAVQKFIDEIQKISKISAVQNFQIGMFENMNDPRALSDFEIKLRMEFSNKDSLEVYQKHPIHLNLKSSTRFFLQSPPKTYDYILISPKS